MGFVFDRVRIIPTSSSAPASFAYVPLEMTALVLLSPPPPPEPPDPPDPLLIFVAPSPLQPPFKTIHRLLTRSLFLDLIGTRSRNYNCFRRVMMPTPDDVFIGHWARESVSLVHPRNLMCPSSSHSSRSNIIFHGFGNQPPICEALGSGKGVELVSNPCSHPSSLMVSCSEKPPLIHHPPFHVPTLCSLLCINQTWACPFKMSGLLSPILALPSGPY